MKQGHRFLGMSFAIHFCMNLHFLCKSFKTDFFAHTLAFCLAIIVTSPIFLPNEAHALQCRLVLQSGPNLPLRLRQYVQRVEDYVLAKPFVEKEQAQATFDRHVMVLPEGSRRMAVEIRKQLANKQAWVEYLKNLVTETALHMMTSSDPGVRQKALSGELYRNSLIEVLTKRAVERGEEVSILTEMDFAQVQEALLRGTFIDAVFLYDGHGADSHLLQTDFLALTLESGWRGRRQEFFRDLFSYGKNELWDEIFDLGSYVEKTPRSPEFIRSWLDRILPIQ